MIETVIAALLTAAVLWLVKTHGAAMAWWLPLLINRKLPSLIPADTRVGEALYAKEWERIDRELFGNE